MNSAKFCATHIVNGVDILPGISSTTGETSPRCSQANLNEAIECCADADPREFICRRAQLTLDPPKEPRCLHPHHIS